MPGNEREGRGAIERARSIYEAVTSGGARAAGARARSVARVLGRTDSSETCMNMEGCRIPARELLHGARSFGGHHRPRRRARRRAYVQVRVVHRDGRRQEVVPVRRRVVRSFRERESDGRGGHGDRRSLRSQPGRAPLDLLDDGLRRRRLDHGSQRIRAPESTARLWSIRRSRPPFVPARLQDLCKLQSNDLGRRQNHFYHRCMPSRVEELRSRAPSSARVQASNLN